MSGDIAPPGWLHLTHHLTFRVCAAVKSHAGKMAAKKISSKKPAVVKEEPETIQHQTGSRVSKKLFKGVKKVVAAPTPASQATKSRAKRKYKKGTVALR